jgi:hypothetical protein
VSDKKFLSELLDRQMTRKEFINWSALLVVSLFGIGGVLETLSSHAATPGASKEAETGTLANGATTFSDSTASGGQAVRFESSRPTLPATSIERTALSDNQALYSGSAPSGQTDFAPNLAATFNLPSTGSPHGYYAKPYNTITASTSYTFPIYVMPENTPRQTIYLTDPSDHGNLQAYMNAHPCPLPDPTKISTGLIQPAGTDAEVAVLCGNELWEFWVFSSAGTNAINAGYTWQCKDFGYIADITKSNGFYASNQYLSPYGNIYSMGVHAAGCCSLFGLLRAEDYLSGTINHALCLALPITGQRPQTGSPIDKLLPATRNDLSLGFDGTDAQAGPYSIPEGSWFRLPAGFDTVAWAAANNSSSSQTVVEMVCRAIRDYGVMICDGSGVMQFWAEDTQTFGTPYNPYSTAQKPVWGNFGQDLPWSKMVQIAPRQAF